MSSGLFENRQHITDVQILSYNPPQREVQRVGQIGSSRSTIVPGRVIPGTVQFSTNCHLDIDGNYSVNIDNHTFRVELTKINGQVTSSGTPVYIASGYIY